MADWTDGPEYAPFDRPTAFDTPPAKPLEIPAAVPNLADGAPEARPDLRPPQAAVTALTDLLPTASESQRDPTTPFATVGSLATMGTAGIGAASWTPDQPLGNTAPIPGGAMPAPAGGRGWIAGSPAYPAAANLPPPTGEPAVGLPPPPANPASSPRLNFPPPQSVPAYPQAAHPGLNFPPPAQGAPSFPQPGTPNWFAPPPQPPWQPQRQPVTLAQMWAGATPGVLIPLIAGALISMLSLVMILLAAALAVRVRYRLEQVRRTFIWAISGLVALGVIILLAEDFDLESTALIMSGWAQFACWVIPVVVLLQVRAGIRANEPPQRR